MKEKSPIPVIDGGSPTYRQEQKKGFALIKEYRRRLHRAEESPSYYGSYDREGNLFDVWENLGPWDKADQVHQKLVHHQGALRILRANGFKITPLREGYEPSLLSKEGIFPTAKEIPVFGEEKPNAMPRLPGQRLHYRQSQEQG